ncbi:ataxin-7-like protein 1 [Fopius arisanus]|uniref:Ataxin-7-like protein 1 n=2 Tax=Fopius arisanus TaxID=64838 RepID=A0A9R1SWM1_9HYME|nr:PREDICTED: ataxin-7-like protein 1 [Fopius arisanus]
MSGSDSPTFFHGQPWSSWIERIGRDKPLSDEEPEVEPSSCVTRLSADDIDLYGFCPERDTFYGVVCELCNAIVKPQALIQHMESRHSSDTVNLPPPSTPASKTTVKTPYCKISKLTKKPQPSQSSSASNNSGNGASGTSATTASNSSKINHTSVKRNAEQALLPTSPLDGSCSLVGSNISSGMTASASTPVPSSPVKSPGNNSSASNTTSNNGAKRKRLKADRGLLKDREYDPDRHCGVWNEETGKPCTRSLTCKAHTVSLRRTVAGRSKSFDKLLAEHRASKDLPNRTSKITVTGTVTLSTASALLNTNLTIANDNDAPGSPPVLSLPDTYPLPKAVDLLYRCLAPHGSTKPTKLEEDFVKEEMRLESTAAAAAAAKASLSAGSMAPISIVLPSLSPIGTSNDASPVATLIPVNTSSSLPAIQTPLPPPNAQLPNTVLEGETLSDVNTESMTLYSPMAMFKDTKSQIIMQIPRPSSLMHSPMSRNYQGQASMPSLVFEDHMDHPKQQLANGKRFNNHTGTSSPVAGRTSRKSKQDFQSDNYSSAIQVETTSPRYPHFSDIAWSNCHPEPLAVSRWLRITSTRKQYNFNIH